MKDKILVLGATGKTGKRVAEALKKLNISYRAGSRNAEIPFDWDQPDTWKASLQGIESVYVTFQPDLAVPGAVETIGNFVESCKKSGVRKIVLLSGRGEKEAQLCEDKVIASGLNYTIIRASWFMQNFSESFLLDSILARDVVLPEVKAHEPFIDVDDIAEVAVEALIKEHHSQKIYELTGPELLTFEEAVAKISNALNVPVRFREVPISEYVAMLKEYQLPDDYVWLIEYLFTEVLDGRNESLTNDVEQALGRKPGTFEAYIEKTLPLGVWNNRNQK